MVACGPVLVPRGLTGLGVRTRRGASLPVTGGVLVWARLRPGRRMEARTTRYLMGLTSDSDYAGEEVDERADIGDEDDEEEPEVFLHRARLAGGAVVDHPDPEEQADEFKAAGTGEDEGEGEGHGLREGMFAPGGIKLNYFQRGRQGRVSHGGLQSAEEGEGLTELTGLRNGEGLATKKTKKRQRSEPNYQLGKAGEEDPSIRGKKKTQQKLH